MQKHSLILRFLIAVGIGLVEYQYAPGRCAWQLNRLSVAFNKREISSDQLSAYVSNCPGQGLYQIGLAYQAQGQNELALAAFHQAHQSNPDMTVAYLKEGELLQKLGRSTEAVTVWRQAHVAPYFENLGIRSLEAQDFSTMKSAFEQSVAIDPNSYMGYWGLSIVYMQAQQWQSMLAAAERALALDPNARDAHYYLGVALMQVGALSKSQEQANQALALDPTYVWSYVLMGDIYRQLHEYDQAERWYRQMLMLSGQQGLAFKYLGGNALDQGQSEAAIDDFTQALVDAAPDSQAELHFYLGQAYAEAHQFGQAQYSLELATQLSPNVETYHLALAEVYQDTNQVQAARDEYHRVLQLAPANAQAASALGQLGN